MVAGEARQFSSRRPKPDYGLHVWAGVRSRRAYQPGRRSWSPCHFTIRMTPRDRCRFQFSHPWAVGMPQFFIGLAAAIRQRLLQRDGQNGHGDQDVRDGFAFQGGLQRFRNGSPSSGGIDNRHFANADMYTPVHIVNGPGLLALTRESSGETCWTSPYSTRMPRTYGI